MTIIPSVPLLPLPSALFCQSLPTHFACRQQTALASIVLCGNFGIHNLSITRNTKGQPLVASLYNWEAGGILPAILSDLTRSLCFDLVEDKNGAPSVTRQVEEATPKEGAQHMRCTRVYFKVCPVSRHCFPQYMDREVTAFRRAGFCTNKYQKYNVPIQSEKDARRHSWFTLQDW